MSFDTNARRQAKELFDALMDRLVKDLSAAAREETEAAVVATRKEAEAAVAAAEKEADATVAATRKEAEATAATARKEAEAAITAARKEADAAVAAVRKDADAAVAAARNDGDVRAAKARAEAEKVAESQLAGARADGEARLASAQAMNAGLMESVDGARQEVKSFEARLAQLEKEYAELLQEKDQIGARLDTETHRANEATHRANELAEALEAARQETNLAKQAASLSKVEADARRQDRELALDRLGAALRTVDRANSPSEILEALLDPLAHDYGKAAVFMVGAAGLKGWRARGLAETNDITKLVIPCGSDALVSRAVTTRKPVQLSANGSEPPSGLWGGPVAGAVALPIHAGDGVVAVAYAEDEEETSSQAVGRKITEMLIKHAALRLTTKGQTSARPSAAAAPRAADASEQPVEYSPARQARRLKLRENIDVVLDGSAGSLVDISSIGAQVLSPLALRPNRVVKMTLRGEEGALACKVRVMWARFEPKGTVSAQYRVGVKFTDVESKAIDGFMARHGIEAPQERKPVKLKDSA